MSIARSEIPLQFYNLKNYKIMKEVESYYQELEAFQKEVKGEISLQPITKCFPKFGSRFLQTAL